MNQRRLHRPSRFRRRRIGARLVLSFAMLLAIGAGALAYYFVPDPAELFTQEVRTEDGSRLVHIALGDGKLVVPQALVARIQRRTLGPVQQIDLLTPWPYDSKASVTQDPGTLKDWVLLHFEPDDGGLTSTERFEKIYVHYFSGPPVHSPIGLLQYDFKADSPYAGLQLFVDRNAAPPVFLRCEMKPSSLGPVLCERRIRVSDKVVLRYRFPRELLERWIEVDRQARTLVERLWKRST